MAAKVHKEIQFPPIATPSSVKNPAPEAGKSQDVDALQAQWMRLHSLFQHHEEGMALTDDFGNFLLANQAFCKMFQKTLAEILEMRIQELMPLKGLQEITAKAHLQAIAREKYYVMGTKIRDRRFIKLRHVVMEEGQNQHHVLIYAAEWTDKIREQAKQAEKEEMLLQVLENSQEPFLLLDTSLTITAFNPLGANLLFQASGRIAQKGASILDYSKSDKQKEKSWKLFREVLSGLIVERESKFVPPGTAFQSTFKITYLPFFDGEGHIYGIYISARDITNRLTDAQTIAHKDVFQKVREKGAHGAMLILTPNWVIRYASEGIAAVLGQRDLDLIGQPLLNLWGQEAFDALTLACNQLKENPDEHIDGKAWLKLKNNVDVFAKYSCRSYLGHPAIQGWVIHLSNSTEEAQSKVEISYVRKVLRDMEDFRASASVVFDSKGQFKEQFTVETFKLQFPAITHEGVSFIELLQLLGKQPKPMLKKLVAGEVVTFQGELMSTSGYMRLMEVRLEYFDNKEIGSFYLVMLSEERASNELERLVLQNTQLESKLVQVERRFQTSTRLLDRLALSAGLLPWRFDVNQHRFLFDSDAQRSYLLERRGNQVLTLKEDAVHPADMPLLEALKRPALSSKSSQQQFEIRLKNEEGLYQPYMHWAQYQSVTEQWEGMWLSLPTAQLSSGNPFLDLKAVWQDLGYGVLQISRHGLRLQFASESAIKLLQLPNDYLDEPIEALNVLKQTKFSAECQKNVVQEATVAFEYFHAPSQKWLHIRFYVSSLYMVALLKELQG